MKAPNFPSFFKKTDANKFNFKPRYYKEKIENKKRIHFQRNYDSKSSNARSKRIIFIIIVLSLLTYFFFQ